MNNWLEVNVVYLNCTYSLKYFIELTEHVSSQPSQFLKATLCWEIIIHE